MPQGTLKSRKSIASKVPQNNKKAQKSKLKIKKGKAISAKKSIMVESKKFKKSLERAINAKIEDEVKALAANDATSLKILKASDKVKKTKKGK